MTAERRIRALKPLAPITFLLRNAGKTIPLTSAIVLAVLLVAGIVTMMDSIPYSIRDVYSYSKEMVAFGPRGDPELTSKLADVIKAESPVKLERTMYVRTASSTVHSIVGKWPFAVVGLEQSDMDYFMKRMSVRAIDGRMPKPGEAGVVVSDQVAQNLGLKLGDPLMGPTNSDSYSPHEVRIIGLAHTPKWIMVTDIEYERDNHFPPIDILVGFAKNHAEQEKFDRWAVERFKGNRAQVFAYHLLDKDTTENFSILYKILDVVIGILVVVVTFMMGMLMNIYQSQRLVEFGLLQAIGYTKRQLLQRVLRETVYVTGLGWALGLLAGYGMLLIIKGSLMDPRAFAMNPLDPVALRYTFPIPFSILLIATLTVTLRFRRFDPVGVVERRLV